MMEHSPSNRGRLVEASRQDALPTTTAKGIRIGTWKILLTGLMFLVGMNILSNRNFSPITTTTLRSILAVDNYYQRQNNTSLPREEESLLSVEAATATTPPPRLNNNDTAAIEAATTPPPGLERHNNNDTAAICVFAKDEELYLEEWILYNKGIGFDQIYIYNNAENRTKLDHWLSQQSPEVQNVTTHHHFPLNSSQKQIIGLKDCIHRYDKENGKKKKRRHKWMAFFESDEYAAPNPNQRG